MGDATLSSAGFADELRPFDRSSYEMIWPLVGIKATRIILEDNYATNVGILYESDDELSSLPLNAKFPAEWEQVLGIASDSLIVYNSDHTVFRNVTAEAWRKFSNQAANQKSIDLVAASGERADAACFLATQAANVNEFWNALRDNHPEDLARIFLRAGLDSSDANFKVWRIGYNGGVRSISARGARFDEGYLWRGGDALLPRPAEAQWFVKTDRAHSRT